MKNPLIRRRPSAPRLWVVLLCAGALAAGGWMGSRLLTPAGSGGTGILYRVTGGKHPLTVLGSIHVGNADMLPYGEDIQSALKAADVLVLECDTADTQEAQALLFYPEGEDLTAHISPEIWEELKGVLPQIGLTEENARTMKPWAISSTAAVRTTMQRMNVRRVSDALKYGVEQQILSMAKELPRVYMESALSQYEALEAMSAPLQEYLLKDAIEAVLHPEMGGMDGDMAHWPEWWKEGNADAFAESYLREMAEGGDLLTEYHELLNRSRNQRMARVLRDLMEGDEYENPFAVVGLMHLVLPGDSILSELENMGYTVRRVEAQP